MKIESVTLCNFRCFGSSPTIISLSEITTLIGSNGCGKTAVLQALSRLFGTSLQQRRLEPSDFHVPTGKSLNDFDEIPLWVEVKLTFPELQNETSLTSAIPECFHHMTVADEQGELFCRIRLEGKWTRSNLPEGYIDEKSHWVITASQDVTEMDKKRLNSHDLASIHVHYIPATRDPARHLKNVSGTMLARLLNAILWSDDAKGAVKSISEQLRQLLQDEAGVKLIHDKIDTCWSALHDDPIYAQPRMQFFGSEFDSVLKQVGMIFRPTQDGADHDAERMSDGQKSLFYFALINSIFAIEQQALADVKAGQSSSFVLEDLRPPALTLFAVEEPENHLAPHYLGRIMEELKRLGDHPAAQVLITSHSPGILGRIDPEDVRYLRVEPLSGVSSVKCIRLPDKANEAFKYIKNAVRAYPEIYFARFVVLGEGDSEEIVLPRVAQSFGLSIDPYFVSVVPLGGRHVNHFWRLLSDLEIPHLTLLDLDFGKNGGGWARIRYACRQLLNIGTDRTALLNVAQNGERRVLTQTELDGMASWPTDNPQLMEGWLKRLEDFDVFFSSPLDLDFMMLEAFPDAYKQLDGEDTGPHIPDDKEDLHTRIEEALNIAFGKQGAAGNNYTAEQKQIMPWYTYLFLGKGKPSTHVLALSRLENPEISKNAPAVLRRIIMQVQARLQKDAKGE